MSISDDDLEGALERLRDAEAGAPSHLARRIVANLPEPAKPDPLGDLLHWLAASYVRGALAFVLPLALGVILGVNVGDAYPLDAEVVDISEQGSIVFVDTLTEYENDEF